MKRFLKSEILFILKNPATYLCVLGVTAAMFFSLESSGVASTVLETYLSSKILSGYILAYPCAAAVYGTVFFNEAEHKFYNYIMVRETRREYVRVRVLTIYFSAVVSVIGGILIFCGILRTRLPWIFQDSSAYRVISTGTFGFLVTSEHFCLYILCNAFYMGLFAGILSLAASYLSLFIQNRIIILCAPVLLLQLLFIFAGSFSIPALFEMITGVTGSFWLNVTVPMLIAVLFVLLSLNLFEKTWERRILEG